MKKTPVILRASAAAIVATVLCNPAAWAATLDDFSTGGLGTASVLGGGLGPTIVPGGPNGNYLHLLNGENSQHNHYTYSLTDPGAYDTISAQFDFRVTAGSNGLADGFHFLLVPTSSFGTSGDGPAPLAEEPNLAGAFGIGFDVYPGLNAVRAHWDNVQRVDLNMPTTGPAVNYRSNNVFNHAQVDLQRVGNGTNVTVTLTAASLSGTPGAPYKAFEITLPNMLPYENRVQFGGRTGGENMNLDIDNLNVSYNNLFTGLATTAPQGHLYQDFDSMGTTNYRAEQVAARTDATFRPGPLIKPAEIGSKGSFMRIANDGVEGQSNRLAFDRAFDAGVSNVKEALDFDVRFNSADTPADGLGVLFLPTTTQGVAGNGIASSEEPNHPGMLGVGFDLYQNAGEGPIPSVSLHWNGAIVGGEVPITDPAIGFGQFHHVQIVREPVVGGLNVSVLVTPDINGVPGTPVTILNNVFVAGATNYDYRMQFTGRTGGANADHDIDNIVSSQLAHAQTAHTQTNFATGDGSGWKAYRYGGNAAPSINTDGGSNGPFLRLMTDGNNDQRNSIVFDKQADGVVAGATAITADFDFRLISPDTPADGFSIMLLPTSTFGDTGPGAAGMVNAEEPNLAGVFGVGFDLYLDGFTPYNKVSLHWNGFTLGELDIDPSLIDLDSGAFNHAHLELTPQGADTLATLILTPNSLGTPATPVTAFSNTVIAGMSFYDYRTEFAARSGGANMTVDLDNIDVRSVPEPTAAMVSLAGLAMIATRRRRK